MSSLEEMFFLKTKLGQKGGLVSPHASFVHRAWQGSDRTGYTRGICAASHLKWKATQASCNLHRTGQ